MRVWRRPTVLVNVALAAVAVGGVLWAVRTVRGPATAEADTVGSQQRVVAVTQGDVTASVSASGNVQSASTAAATFVTDGTVTEILVKVGDVVSKGQKLAKVDATLAQAQLDTAKANRTAAGANLTRVRAAGGDAASVAAASATVSSADAEVAGAEAAVEGTVLTAPIAGTVTAVNGAIGSASNATAGSGSGSDSGSDSGAGTGFVAIADLATLQVSANFAEADATKLTVGQAAAITWSALSGTRATGTVATVAPTATTQNNVNSYAVVVSIASPPAGVRLGQSTTVQVTVAEAAGAVRVPTLALRGSGNQRTVDVMVDGAVETRTVEIGVEGNQFAEVRSGLAVGDRVVVTMQSGGTGSNQGPGGLLPGGGFQGGGFQGGGAGPGGGRGGN
jgi:macrolide-specific efflux system membrane fusion protein